MKPLIAITMGDFNGVGPEIALKSILSRTVRKICFPVLVGSIDVFEYYARRLRLRINLREVSGGPFSHVSGCCPVINIHPFERPRLAPGRPSVQAGKFAGEAITASVKLCVAGVMEGMVTAPVSKSTMAAAGFRFPGQTELVASLSGRAAATMMLIADTFRVGLATVHVPLDQISRHISRELIVQRLAAMDTALKKDFGIRSPKIAVLGLNPHAGEHGLLGSEEIAVISPAIGRVRRSRIHAEGPFPADGFFGTHSQENFDAVLAMYHDQGLIPLKMSGFNIGVNYTAGLPIVRTSPDHGTAFDIAGKGLADPGSIIEAIGLAVMIIHNRKKRR